MNNFEGRTILITGGTGSFGHEVLNRMLDTDYKEIRIFSRDELKQDVMRKKLNNPKVKFYIGDVRDRGSVDGAMSGVDIVFHAAALKQVPSCEFFPMQAVMTNIMGSNNVVESAVAHKVDKVICLSTDKAVYPINAMGISKALMEKVVQSVARRLTNAETVVACVRYGNVMCSRGSVIPLFMRQIMEEKPITITDPKMTRFLLPLRTAIDLVLFAFEHANQGDVFIRKSPACTVETLAVAMKNLFKSSVPIEVIGIRHGEKIHETLANIEELRKAEDLGDYFRVRADDRDLNYSKFFEEGDVEESLLQDYTSHSTHQMNVEEVEELLLTLPEVVSALNGNMVTI